MTAEVTVIVVNLNGERYLERCLSTVLAQTPISSPGPMTPTGRSHWAKSALSFEVILVDNGSTDHSVALVRDRFPTVRVIENGENLGFATANNMGIRASDAPFVATLNNDTWVEPDWLETLVEAMKSDSGIGICASKMLFAHQPEIINSAGVCMDLVGIAWDRLGGIPEEKDTDEPIDVFAACAGAALYRRTMLDDVGLFDEDYFIYLEDVDLAWRAQLMGWRCVYVPRSRVYHIYSGTTGQGSAFKNFLLARNKVWTIVKNYPSPQFWLYLPLIVLYDLGSMPYSLLIRGETAALRGRLAAIRQLPRTWRKRREIQNRRCVSFEDLRKVLSPLESPMALLHRYKHLASLPSTDEPAANPTNAG